MPNDEFNDEELEQLTDQLQVGDRTEGARALQKVIQRAQAQGQAAVRQELTGLRAAAETQGAVNQFTQRYPVLRGDPELAATATRVALDHIVQDLRTAGYAETDIAAASDDLTTLGQMHERARTAGCKVRDPHKLIDDVGTALERDHGVRPGREGEERARNLRWFNETRRARGYGVIDDLGKKTQSQAPQRRTPREVIDHARATRGYPQK